MNFKRLTLSYKRKKHFKTLAISALLMGSIAANAQDGSVGIGTFSPDESAILELSSKSKGLLLPRLSLQERTKITNPATGLMIYQTNYLSGLYVFDGDTWSALGGTEAKLTAEDASNWSLTGNSGLNPFEHFIGSTDNAPLIFKVNNAFSGKIDYSQGNLFFGYKAAEYSSGYNSVVLGALAMQKNNTSGNNIAIGFQSMYSNETGGDNVAIGRGTMAVNVYGEKNVNVGSLAGYKSTGSGNVFIGFQAGYDEQGSNTFIIDNSPERTPLIYGNFATGKIGFNTKDLESAVNINSGQVNSSGLRFTNLNSNSSIQGSNGKVLSVNNRGEVILTNDLQAFGGNHTKSYWSLDGGKLINNSGDLVVVNKDFNVNQHLWSNALTVGTGGLYITNLGSASASNGRALSIDNNGRVFLTQNSDGGSGGFWSKSGEVIYSDTGQKIAIGGDIPGLPGNYSLYVKNGILTEHLRVALTSSEKWADYVFADDYKLMPLSEVENFIEKNNHLPNVRSAEQIAKEGIDITQMASKQMEKIEELTLYIIAANKRIEKLEEALLAKD